MLPLPEICDKSYAELLEEIMQKIPTMTENWTDYNEHDPGITIMQTYTWLCEMQQYYGEAIGDEHFYKYLKLLDYKPKSIKPAEGTLTFSNVQQSIVLPKGTKFYAGGICYELAETEKIYASRLERVYRGEHYTDITEMLAHEDEGYDLIFTKEDHVFYIGLSTELPLENKIQLYFQIYEGHQKRKHFNPKAFHLSECVWEIYSETGWQQIEKVHDATAHFLMSGRVTFMNIAGAVPISLGQDETPHYFIRCTLIKDEYDVLPRVNEIAVNVVPIVQEDTRIISLYFDDSDEKKGGYLLGHYLAYIGNLVVLAKTEDGLWQVLKENKDYVVEKKETETWLYMKEKEASSSNKKETKTIRVICYMAGEHEKSQLGIFKGYIHQSFEIEREDVEAERIKLDCLYEKGRCIYYDSYERVENIEECGPKSKSYAMGHSNKIIFGDRHHGMFPRQTGTPLVLTGLSYSKGEAGNIKKGQIQSVDETARKMIGNVTFTNEDDIMTGKDGETKEKALIGFRQEFKKLHRAVTAKDYEDLVQNLPGILVGKVKAMSEKCLYPEKLESQTVYIVVKHESKEPRKPLPEQYRLYIEEQLEKYRLLTVKVKVISPRYLPVDVYGTIYMKEKPAQDIVYRLVKRAVDGVAGKRMFGETLILGKLFGSIESMKEVSYIKELSIEPVAGYGRKTLTGDIETAPDVLTYLRNYHVELR